MEWSSHAGEEFIYVTSGAVELHTEFYAPAKLDAGDSAYIDSSMRHAFVSTSAEDATMLSICMTESLTFNDVVIGAAAADATSAKRPGSGPAGQRQAPARNGRKRAGATPRSRSATPS